MDPDHYLDGREGDDDQCWACGYDYDVIRWTNNDGSCVPMQDTPGYEGPDFNLWFGSAHANGFQMAFCDGSVHVMSYTISQQTHYRLGNPHDGLPIDAKTW
jgi:prepilin-type processing-associated H-X9-DG protein